MAELRGHLHVKYVLIEVDMHDSLSCRVLEADNALTVGFESTSQVMLIVCFNAARTVFIWPLQTGGSVEWIIIELF